MSFLSWLTGKRSAPATAAKSAPGPSRVAPPPTAGGLDPAAVRKVKRADRRERVQDVVRDTMLQAGALSGSYKFKVLALDERGRRFLVMVDLSGALAGDTARLLRLEEQVAQMAKARHGLEISGIYWRPNQQLAGAASTPAASAAATPPLPTPAPAPQATPQPASPYAPIHTEELLAFKRALAQAEVARPATQGEVRKSGARVRTPDFEDTQATDGAERPDALGHTQYGDLR